MSNSQVPRSILGILVIFAALLAQVVFNVDIAWSGPYVVIAIALFVGFVLAFPAIIALLEAIDEWARK